MCAVHLKSGVSGAFVSYGSVEAFVHRLSKEARLELLRILIEASGSVKVVAERIGVSRQAVYQFLAGRTHASDKIMIRVLENLSLETPYYRKRALGVLRREMEAVVQGYASVMELLSPGHGGMQ